MLLADKIEDLNGFQGDGLIGMGFDTLSDHKHTFIDNLFKQG